MFPPKHRILSSCSQRHARVRPSCSRRVSRTQVDAHFVQSSPPCNASSWRVRPLNIKHNTAFALQNHPVPQALLPVTAASHLVRHLSSRPFPQSIIVTFVQVLQSDPTSCPAGGIETAFDKFQALLLTERAALPLMRDVVGHMASYDVCGPTDAATGFSAIPPTQP
jgi:hypothetical protein